jgi:serine/threonine protein kinase
MSGLEALLAGKVLVNRYRIGDVIGRGGFAAVYRADDERLGREVAVKVITLTSADPAAQELLRERFQREARAVAALPQHPNVVTVYDFGRDPETGIDFLVMELLRGEDLATRLAREPRLPLDLATCILREAVEGVAVGHRAGLVHRDVKPGNVFLAEPQGGAPFRVCVLDFGIARLAADEGTASRLTQQGTTPLSPAYASPEQLRGEVNLTPASDVFSLGVVAYQLLTGERPFPPERRRGPEGWKAPPLLEKNRRVPVRVAEAVHRALAFEPADRFPHAAAFASALGAATGGAPPAWPVVAAAAGDTAVGTPPGDRRSSSIPQAAAVGAAAGALAEAAAADHDRTLVQRSAPPGPHGERRPLAAPLLRRSMAVPIAVFVVLLLAGGAAMAAWLGRGGRDRGQAASARADSAASAPTTAATGGSAASPAVPGSALDTRPSVPAGVDTLSPPPEAAAPAVVPGTGQPSPVAQPPATGAPPAPPVPRPASPGAPTPAPAQPSPQAAPPPQAPPPESASAQPPAQQTPPPAQPQPAPRDTVHIGAPPPRPAPKDTLKLGPPSPPSPPPAPAVPPPSPTTGSPPPPGGIG